YLGQAEKTSERFLKNPFVTDPEAKMYRTGDRARYLEDGNIELLGRGDDQVKIRGFRIELGEFESALARHDSIKQAGVMAREDEQAPQKTYVAPRTATERTIAEIWAEVLRREKDMIGIDDNFFDLGGHSLLATQVISRVRRALNIELPLRTLFESPTIASLAEQAEKTAGASQPEIPRISRVPRNQPLPLSFAQQRLWVLDQIEPNNPLYNI